MIIWCFKTNILGIALSPITIVNMTPVNLNERRRHMWDWRVHFVSVALAMQRKRREKKAQGRRQPQQKYADKLAWTRRLVHHDALPSYLRDNEFLHKHHRPQLNSVLECFKSIFRIHSETGNIWTHLIGNYLTNICLKSNYFEDFLYHKIYKM